jgi:hypothetical protein
MWRSVSALLLLVLVSAAGAQEPPPPPDPTEGIPPEEDKLPTEGSLFDEAALGPTPGAPTIDLQSAIARALEANFSILSSADALQGAKIRESASRSAWYPRFTPWEPRASGCPGRAAR